jgi:hypothetical protein
MRVHSLSDSIISGNRASGRSSFVCGGGIYNQGELSLTNTIVSNNIGSGGSSISICGGGIFNVGRLSLTNSTVSDNKASAGIANPYCAGGIFNSGILSLTNSTVSGNSASAGSASCSGGIFHLKGALSLTNSTVSGNTTTSNGGGIFSRGGQITITFCTIYGNTAHEAGGISTATAKKSGDSMIVRNSIIARNTALNYPDIAGRLFTGGYNLIQNSTGADFVNASADKHLTDISGDQFTNLGIDPTLRDNGGYTRTHRLLQGSPAIDAIPPAACNIPEIFDNATHKYIDQRGVQRPHGKRCDIGAYEYG